MPLPGFPDYQFKGVKALSWNHAKQCQSTGTPTLITSYGAPSGLTQSAGVATATGVSSSGFSVHFLQPGDLVLISGVTGTTPEEYNGVHQVLTVPSTTSFTFRVAAAADAAPGFGSAEIRRHIPFRVGRFWGRKSTTVVNTGQVRIGPIATNQHQPVPIDPYAAQREVVIAAPPGTWFDLADWYLDVETVSDGVWCLLSF